MHQCVHCGKLIEAGSREILDGCLKCHGRFFFYIRDEQAAKLKESQFSAEKELPVSEFNRVDKKKVEEDVRQILKIDDEMQPVILDIESVRVIRPGKFEIDLVSLMNRKPIVFKLEEGKYIIDLESGLPKKQDDK
jgi:predicted  nucleic acid-binding Zn-ribbon protein